MKIDDTIKFRIRTEEKKKWKKYCEKEGISITELILASVKKRMTDRDRRRIIKFLDTQDNIFAKVENNINQLARIANAQKFLLPSQQQQFLDYLEQLVNLRTQQTKTITSIYRFMAKDDSKNFFFGE